MHCTPLSRGCESTNCLVMGIPRIVRLTDFKSLFGGFIDHLSYTTHIDRFSLSKHTEMLIANSALRRLRRFFCLGPLVKFNEGGKTKNKLKKREDNSVSTC